MSPTTKARALIATSVGWFFLFGSFAGRKDNPFESESLNIVLGALAMVIPFFLPWFGFRLLRGQPRTSDYKVLLFPAFVISLLPLSIFLFLIGVRVLVHAPR